MSVTLSPTPDSLLNLVFKNAAFIATLKKFVKIDLAMPFISTVVRSLFLVWVLTNSSEDSRLFFSSDAP